MIRQYRTKRERVEAIRISQPMLDGNEDWPFSSFSPLADVFVAGDWLVRSAKGDSPRHWVHMAAEPFWEQFEEDTIAPLRLIK